MELKRASSKRAIVKMKASELELGRLIEIEFRFLKTEKKWVWILKWQLGQSSTWEEHMLLCSSGGPGT